MTSFEASRDAPLMLLYVPQQEGAVRIDEHDVVKLKDGREGTVVFVFSEPRTAYLVEVPLDDEWEQITVEPEDVDRILWRARTQLA